MIRKSLFVITGLAMLAGAVQFSGQPQHLLRASDGNNCPIYYGCPPPVPAPNPGPDNGDKDEHHRGRNGGGKDGRNDSGPHHFAAHRSVLA
jgi:hypothetical protein